MSIIEIIKKIVKHRYFLPVVMCASVSIIFIITLISIVYFREKVISLDISNTDNYRQYEKHYALITNNTDTPFWDSVYEEAKKEAEEYNAYVEYMGKDLSQEYSIEVLLQIAIDCDVDGIIIEGNESEAVTELINEAENKGITVVTVLKDSPKSQRQCFVGVNNYNLGQIYGQQVLEICNEETKRIAVLMDSSTSNSNQNIIFSGIKETIRKGPKKSKALDVQNITVNNDNAFSSEETIRDIIINKKSVPDILICLSSIDTKCAYQAVVDHNKVGSVNILGYYNSKDILSAIQKEIIYSTISIDAKQMGSLCVQALKEYETTGHVSEYFPVDTELITLNNVDLYLQEQK